MMFDAMMKKVLGWAFTAWVIAFLFGFLVMFYYEIAQRIQ